MPAVTIKPTDAAIRRYQETLGRLHEQRVDHEGGLRRAFGTLLKETARKRDWTLIEELPVSGGRLRPDGTLRDRWLLPHGYWGARDGRDDLEVEIRRKRERGYPFSSVRDAGRELARLHLNYERERPWDLDWEIDPDKPVNYRVEKMRPLKRVQSGDGDYRIFDSLEYNKTLTLRGIPAGAFRYRLGTRSALEWVIDQYRVKTDKRSGIVSDPNNWKGSRDEREKDQRYIVDLVGRVITVSMATVKIVDDLAGLPLLES